MFSWANRAVSSTRLRRVAGRLAGERAGDGRLTPVWITGEPEGYTLFGPQEIRRFQWWRDHYFDGTRVL